MVLFNLSFLPPFQMALRRKSQWSPGPRKEPRYTLLFSQKSQQTNPLQIHQQDSCEKRGPPTGHFAYLSTTSSFGFPSKRAFPQGPLWNPSQRDAAIVEPSFIHLSKSSVESPPPTAFLRRQRGPHREGCPNPVFS